MEKKDQLTLVQIHCLGQKTEDQLLLKQINYLKFKTLKPLLDLGSFFCHFYNHKSNLNDDHI